MGTSSVQRWVQSNVSKGLWSTWSSTSSSTPAVLEDSEIPESDYVVSIYIYVRMYIYIEVHDSIRKKVRDRDIESHALPTISHESLLDTIATLGIKKKKMKIISLSFIHNIV